ncbi:MAG: FliM/FliN family flagellar motor switch protein [Terracidiphilus sp.]|jgi:flagellar motor switch protein FliN/FliY
MKTYLECWIGAAEALFSQALAGEPKLVESLPKPLGAGSFGFAATVSGEVEGRFAVLLDAGILESPLLGEGMDQRAGWGELLREVANAAAGDLLAKGGKKCRVETFEETPSESKVSLAFQLNGGDRSWTILVLDEVRAPKPSAKPAAASSSQSTPGLSTIQGTGPALNAGLELLLDVELEATLRFGCREMLLGEILDLGPGDVVQLDRHVSDPVDLIVGDKIVACGEVVLVNGNFGLRVTEVASPRKRLESIRCLF